jgi:serine/threonine-protein kinase
MEFSLDRDAWLHQVATGGPLPFTANDCPAWPALEEVLARALDVDPVRRFGSVSELLAAFESVTARRRTIRPAKTSGSKLRTAVLQRLAVGQGLDGGEDFQVLGAPLCSINYGAAGIAWYLYRVAGLRDEPRLLSAADLWCTRALQLSGDAAAFEDPGGGITIESTGPISPFHRMSGLHLLSAHLCLARGDTSAAEWAASAFVESSDVSCDDPDLTLGWTSALLGCAALVEAFQHSGSLRLESVLAVGGRLAGAVEGWLAEGPVSAARSPQWLGLAHGWAGLLFGLLRWTEATGAPLPDVVRQRLDELAAHGIRLGAQVSWPLRLDDERHDRGAFTGWCHGSAGYVLLWTLASRILGDENLLHLARQAASHIDACQADERVANGSLCCGYAGQGFALLALYRATGERSTLQLAESLGELAAGLASRVSRPNSLFKGKVGIALLLEELAFPDRSCMPLVESEGWAR